MNQAELHRLRISTQNNQKSSDLNRLFELRSATNLTLIKNLFFSLYAEENNRAAFEKLLVTLRELFKTRPNSLKKQDVNRLQEGDWYKSAAITGMQLYVDHFSDNLKGLEKKIEYFEKLGVNFLHLMPITPRPKGENDGGYAVNSYHEVDPSYGTKADLLRLTKKLREKNIFLMLDFVANHTSDEFRWAKKAKKGDVKYQNYYYTFDGREVPNAFEKTLPEIFPMTSPGNFTYDPEMKKWVMTVFNRFQWDLNYSNPEVFIEMLSNLIELVNLGVDVVRLDALAFMWKKLGTQSQNLPEAHALISLFRMCIQVIAPGVIFLAEAIVAPNEIIKYFGTGTLKGNECEIAYNATLMALLWDAIATKKTKLLYKNLENLPIKPDEATWITYIRCHDDIGLGFEDRYINEIGWDAKQHRKFLLDYYSGQIEWSPSRGAIFMYNPKTGDGRITGSCASLLGLEKAFELKNKAQIKVAISKIIMMHGIILSYGGIPLIYAGDEIGTLNDYSYLKDVNKKEDSRWVNRPTQNWKVVDNLDNKKTHHSEIFFTLQHLIRLRKENPVLADNNNLELYNSENPHVLVFERTSENEKGLLVICNFDEVPQTIRSIELGAYVGEKPLKNIISSKPIKFVKGTLELKPYQLLWLKKA
jgi:amylosucrase